MSRAVLVVACLVATVGLAAAVNQGVDAARWPAGAAAPRITAQLSAASVPVGGSLTLSVHVTPAPADGVLVWPYVDGKQWGAWGNATSANDGSVDIIMPFPNTGSHDVIVAVLTAPPATTFPVGTPLVPANVVAQASAGSVSVTHRFVGGRGTAVGTSNTTVLMEWETWFTPFNGAGNWQGAEAIPVLGKYSSFNADVVKQHAFWARTAGVGGIVIDWTNNLWNDPSFKDRAKDAQEIINATTFLIQQYQALRDAPSSSAEVDPPKVVLLLGLDNGAKEPIAALNEEVAWIANNYLKNYSASNWLMVDGKPLLIVFDGANLHAKESPLVAPQFTVRWMASQLQVGNIPSGYWSWMDGSAEPVVVYNGGVAEAMTVTPAYFPPDGWLSPAAKPRLGGSTLLAQLEYARTVKPEFLVVCQWNEFAGTPESPTVKHYADSYNVSLSNDLEPTSLTDCGVARPNDRGCVGWGFAPLNMLSAMLYLVGNPAAKSTVMALQAPLRGASYGSGTPLAIEWVVVGTPASTFEVFLDGNAVISSVSSTSATLDLAKLGVTSGTHTVTVRCVGCTTLFPISQTALDDGPLAAGVAAAASVSFNVYPHAPPPPADVESEPVGFAALTSTPPYEYGPTIILQNAKYHAWYCSPGTGTTKGAWDAIRYTTSADGASWSSPEVALTTSNLYNYNSVCDPSVVRFRGVYYMYHTCINTVNPPDGYKNNRICVAMSDSISGPWSHYPTPVIQNLTCPSTGPYCVGQPSAVVWDDTVIVYYTLVDDATTQPPNPGNVLRAVSSDGVTFTTSATPILTQRDVDVKVNRNTGRFFLVQGDVGSSEITWSTSDDGGVTWQPYDAAHSIRTNPSLPAGGTNNNPGIAGAPDGTFAGDTFIEYGSSYTAGWGDWHLYRSDVVLDAAANNCTHCAPNSCDWACSQANPSAPVVHGRCVVPGSTDPARCCACTTPDAPPSCSACAPTGCVAACKAGGHATGWCAHPGSTDPSVCCACS